MGIRRVVAGHDKSGRSVIVSDEIVQPVAGHEFGEVFVFWSADELPSFPSNGEDPKATTSFPPPGGYRFFRSTIAPHTPAPAPAGELVDRGEQSVRGNITGFHETDTIDFDIVLQGEATVTTSNGQTVTLKPGDFIVHNGESHAWSNAGDVPAVLAGVIVGGHRRGLRRTEP
jgi:mannose-6-phosphate isomerase-like protein (cupin superfamily)